MTFMTHRIFSYKMLALFACLTHLSLVECARYPVQVSSGRIIGEYIPGPWILLRCIYGHLKRNKFENRMDYIENLLY